MMIMIYIGRYARIISLPEDNYGEPIEGLRQTSIGKICRVVAPFGEVSDGDIRTKEGFFLVDYAIISKEGVGHISFYLSEDNVEWLDATEEMILLYSDDLWQLIKPFGEKQITPTFSRLANTFGLITTH